MKKLAVLISNKGTGTNLQAIIDGIKTRKINAEIIVVISDSADSLGLARAKNNNLHIEIVPKKEDLIGILNKYAPDYICLAGWKQIILPEVINAFPERILNIHPGIIPDFINGSYQNLDGTLAIWNKGKMTDKAIKNFFDQHATYAGSTIHFLSDEFDFGTVLARCFEKIETDDTVDSLYSRLKIKENNLYQDVLVKLCS